MQEPGTCLVIMTNSANGEVMYGALLQDLPGDTWNPVDWEGFEAAPRRHYVNGRRPRPLPPGSSSPD